MHLSVSTDFGAPYHWERVVDCARRQGVRRVVFWGDFGKTRFGQPFLYPRYPGLLPPEWTEATRRVRDRLAHAARLAREAGLEFWFCYQVLMHPPKAHVARVCPEFFGREGEPDLAGDFLRRYLLDQMEELRALVPHLAGLEVWIMECASTVVSGLRHQTLPLAALVERLVAPIHDHARRHDLRLSLELHTAGGHRPMLDAILAAAQRRPDVYVGADHTVGDFHLRLPFNPHLKRAARTNPLIVHFDLNGEYWGRNFVPTCAVSLYAAHLEEARPLNVAYVDGRLATGHDQWSPHANVRPSCRRWYPQVQAWDGGGPFPWDLELCCADTLGGFNTEFFCRRARDPAVRPRAVVAEFVRREFGPRADALTDILLDVETVAAGLFFADANYFNAQSIFLNRAQAVLCGLDEHLTTPAGAPFPPPTGMPPPDARCGGGVRAQFAGSPVPEGHGAAGPAALLREKQEALARALTLLDRVREATREWAPADRRFLVRQFEDLVSFARAAALVMETMLHYFHLRLERRNPPFPDATRLRETATALADLAGEWRARYAEDQWQLALRLDEWAEHARCALTEQMPTGR